MTLRELIKQLRDGELDYEIVIDGEKCAIDVYPYERTIQMKQENQNV